MAFHHSELDASHYNQLHSFETDFSSTCWFLTVHCCCCCCCCQPTVAQLKLLLAFLVGVDVRELWPFLAALFVSLAESLAQLHWLHICIYFT